MNTSITLLSHTQMLAMMDKLRSLKERLTSVEIVTRRCLPSLCSARPLTDEFVTRTTGVEKWRDLAEAELKAQEILIGDISDGGSGGGETMDEIIRNNSVRYWILDQF